MKQQMTTFIHTLFKIVLCIIGLTLVEFFSLAIVATIPKENIKKHTEQSAEILLENDVFYYVNTQDYASQIDRYADSILLNIAYCYDNGHPFESIMRSSYYYDQTQNENNNLQTTVAENKAATKDYIRYWHGSNILVKPLLLLTNIDGIYTINAITIIILLILSLLLLWKKISPSSAICMMIACVAVSLWYVPFSLEYTWNIILMFLSIILSCFLYKKSIETLCYLFVILGNLTAFFDFLSTETITYTVPLICILLLKQKEQMQNHKPDYIKTSLYTGCSWITGYVAAWIMKWLLASIILRTNAFALALQQASTRISGEVADISTLQQTLGALIRNISCLFPLSLMKDNGFFAFIVVITLLAIFYYLFKKEKDTTFSTVLMGIALVPYVRFLFLSNHSYLHYFFTYRAQLASVFAIGLAIVYGIDTDLLKKEWRKLCRHWKNS